MTKMAAMPLYGKNLKNFLLWNQKADDLETWYDIPGLALTYFTERSNLEVT